jgi:hypothetical protein
MYLQKQVNRLAISPDKMYLAAAGNASVRSVVFFLPCVDPDGA